MKSKATLLVLMVEIIAIVVLHSNRSTGKIENNRSANSPVESSSPTQFQMAEEKHVVSYTSLK